MRIEWNRQEIQRMAGDPVLRQAARDVGVAIARDARAAAPKRTGAGAASLRSAEVLIDARWEIQVGADQLHAYMRFPDRGTRYIPAQFFLEHAAERNTRGR